MGYCNGSKKVNRDKSVLHVASTQTSFGVRSFTGEMNTQTNEPQRTSAERLSYTYIQQETQFNINWSSPGRFFNFQLKN